jgi:hypothetical protein
MSSILMTAFNQWANRPADESFDSLEALHNHVLAQWKASAESTTNVKALRVDVIDDQPVLVGPSGIPARFTHHSFQQFARRVGAPASYLRQLPALLAAQNLNNGIESLNLGTGEDDKTLFLRTNKGFLVRAFNTDSYTRFLNHEITARLLRLQREQGWHPAPAAFDGKRGLYAGDRDMFVFMVDDDRRIFETLPGGGLSRGFFVSNSEIGNSRSFKLTMFLYEWICGNHRVVGAKDITEISIPHRGDAAENRAMNAVGVELRKYANVAASEQEAMITKARATIVGSNKDEILDAIFGLKVQGLTRDVIGKGYDVAVKQEERYGNPNSAWAITGGITEYATTIEYADERNVIDRAAGKLLEKITF